jgi:hypothetical protein
MKVFIQSNKYQLLAAKVAKFSFLKNGADDVEIMEFESNNILQSFIGWDYLRNHKINKYANDLQSFTFLRFLAPELMNFKGYCLVVDPDVFALKSIKILEAEIDDKHDIFCTFYNDKPRSEVMVVNCNRVNWNFSGILEKVFSKNLDYKDLMSLQFPRELKIKRIDIKYNEHDHYDDTTVFLHTTNRITQPWKYNLPIDFQRYISKKEILKNLFKKLIGLNYNREILSNKYLRHKDPKVISLIRDFFSEALNKNFITEEDINISIKNNYVSRHFINNEK